MINYLRAFAAFLTGKLKKNKSLYKGFLIFLIFLGVIWGFTAYNASMSFTYYLYQAGTLWIAPYAALSITVLIAVSIVFAGAFWIDHVQDWVGGRLSPDRDVWLAIVIFIYWGSAQGWDIYVNFKGIKPAAEFTTIEAMEDKSGNVQSNYDTRLDKLRGELLAYYNPYYWCTTHKKRHDVHNPIKTSNSYLGSMEIPKGVCSKEKFWFACGSANGVDCGDHEKTIQRIADKQTAIDVEDGLRVTAVGIAQGEYLEDQGRYKGEISDRTETHSYMIIVSYFIIFLCTIFTGRYSNKIGDFLDKNYGKGLNWIGGEVKPKLSEEEAKEMGLPETSQQERKLERVASAGVGVEGLVVIPEVEEKHEKIERIVPASGITRKDLEEVVGGILDQKQKAPNNKGKTYKKKEEGKTLSRTEEIKLKIKQYKANNPDLPKSEAVKPIHCQAMGVGRTSAYKYWDKV